MIKVNDKPGCVQKTKNCFNRFVEANKRMLKKLDIFAVPKQNASDENLDYTSAIGGVFTICFVATILFIVIWFTLSFINTPTTVTTQTTTNYGIQDFSSMTTAQKAVYDKILGIPLNFNVSTQANVTNFDFGIFFPDYYNATLDLLFIGQPTNPLAVLNKTVDLHGNPYQMFLSRFVAIVTVDTTATNLTQYTIPFQFLQTYRLNNQMGRVYAPKLLNNYTVGANFKIDIILEFVYNSYDLNQDFTPLYYQKQISQVIFLYKEYEYSNSITKQLNQYPFNFLPASGGSPVSMGGCNGLTVQANVLGLYYTTGLPAVKSQQVQKLTNWQIANNFYTFSDYSGLCPLNNQISSVTVLASENASSLTYSTPHLYQPFVISITSGKIMNEYNVIFEDALTLVAQIGGFVSLVLSVFTGVGKALNKKYFQQDIVELREKAIERTNLLNLKYNELDEYQRNVYLFLSNKLRRRTLKQDFEHVKKRGTPLDNELVNEARKYKFFEKIEKHDDEMVVLLNSDEKANSFISNTPIEPAKASPLLSPAGKDVTLRAAQYNLVDDAEKNQPSSSRFDAK